MAKTKSNPPTTPNTEIHKRVHTHTPAQAHKHTLKSIHTLAPAHIGAKETWLGSDVRKRPLLGGRAHGEE